MPETSNFSGKRPRAVGLLGGGVIGGGWAARFVLNGVDVRLYVRSTAGLERVQKMLANARRAYQRLMLVPLPAEGALTVVESIADAVRGVDLVQESVPEHLELKQQLLAVASGAAEPGTLICSSTSGFRPSVLQGQMDHPECMLVAHPFAPVYLLPLVELSAGQRTTPEALTRAENFYRSVGMHPLVVRKEVDAFIANRIQEAAWREALWLVHDDLATVQEVDDAVRYSFGLRRPIMGPFLAYLIGSGVTDMRQTMKRFGASLKKPWSKFTNVPELTDTFLDKLAEQARAQAGTENLTITELEQKRDDGLVAILRGLRSENSGAGEALARWERKLRDRPPQIASDSGPLRTLTFQIPSDWLDHNGQITQSHYVQLFHNATEALFRYIGIDNVYRLNIGSYYPLEAHLSHCMTLYTGDRVQVLTRVLSADEKRIHLFQALTREGDDSLAATSEEMMTFVRVGTGRSGPVQGNVRDRLLELARLHSELPYPERAGAIIGIR